MEPRPEQRPRVHLQPMGTSDRLKPSGALCDTWQGSGLGVVSRVDAVQGDVSLLRGASVQLKYNLVLSGSVRTRLRYRSSLVALFMA